MTSRTRSRLNVEDWLMAGFRALARSGPDDLKAERLARDLGTTKGSFYWHFTDLPDYLNRLIQVWEERAFDGVIAQLDPVAPPRARLEQLCMIAVTLQNPEYGGEALEPALRAWALISPDVAKAVARMDARRLEYLVSLCGEAGVEDPNGPSALYALIVGLETLGLKDSGNIMRLVLHGL